MFITIIYFYIFVMIIFSIIDNIVILYR